MYPALENVDSRRVTRLAPKLANASYRHSYMSTQLRTWLADQVRALRGDLSQTEFGKLIGKPQTVVSRLEDSDYGRLTLETLLDVASKLDIALLVRFVDYGTFLLATNDFSESAIRPEPYNQLAINALASHVALQPDLPRSGTYAFDSGSSLSLGTGGGIYSGMVSGTAVSDLPHNSYHGAANLLMPAMPVASLPFDQSSRAA